MRAGWIVAAVLLIVALPATADAQYAGPARCRGCHLPQAKSWETTRMARAFELLKPGVAAEQKRAKKLDPDKDYTRDAECLSCHVTGYGKPGGFVSVEKTPALAGVTCEACHGAGAGYLKPELMSLQNKEYKRADLLKAGLVVPDAKVCESCHNARSPFFEPFDFAARKKQGVHAHLPLKYRHE